MPSFKQLKLNSKGGKKKGKGSASNPVHIHYAAGFKGFGSAVADSDYYTFEDGSLLVLVAEEVYSFYHLQIYRIL